MWNWRNYLKLLLIFLVLHCKFERSFSAPRCQISPKAPGADAIHCGAISVTAGTNTTTSIENHNNPQWDPVWPFGAGPDPVNRAIMALIGRANLAPKIVLYFTHQNSPFWGLKQNF